MKKRKICAKIILKKGKKRKLVVFKRKIYNDLLDWKNKYKGTQAVLIKGARRVGKVQLLKSLQKKSTSHI